MTVRAFSSRWVATAAIMLVLGIAAVWPWQATGGGGDAPAPGHTPSSPAGLQDEPHRSPIALALSADGTRLLAANQTAGTVSLVDTRGAPRAR